MEYFPIKIKDFTIKNQTFPLKSNTFQLKSKTFHLKSERIHDQYNPSFLTFQKAFAATTYLNSIQPAPVSGAVHNISTSLRGWGYVCVMTCGQLRPNVVRPLLMCYKKHTIVENK